MFLKRMIIPFSVCLIGASCDKNNSSGHDLELLTHASWKYEKAGFDSNEDGVFDALDPRIAGCEKDNTITFRNDGSGSLEEGPVKCKLSDPDSLPFSWSFQNKDSTFYFQDQYFKVRSLTRDWLEIFADQSLGGVSTRYVIILKH
ncbi:hypothetical protein ACX0G9_07475 [Flavitalea flava]